MRFSISGHVRFCRCSDAICCHPSAVLHWVLLLVAISTTRCQPLLGHPFSVCGGGRRNSNYYQYHHHQIFMSLAVLIYTHYPLKRLRSCNWLKISEQQHTSLFRCYFPYWWSVCVSAISPLCSELLLWIPTVLSKLIFQKISYLESPRAATR
jgi:hypothetical protein